MLQRIEGIVLRTVRYNDHTIIAHLYTLQMGRASFRVAIPRSRKAAVKSVLFQPLALLELVSDVRPTTTIYSVREAKSICPFTSIPYDPVKAAIALFLAEFLSRTVREEGTENIPLYTYLSHSIRWLDTSQGSVANFHLVFLMRFSRFLGLYPNLDNYGQGNYFDLLNGCFTPTRPALHLSFLEPEEASRISRLMRMNYDTMHLFSMNRSERNRCLHIMNEYYRLHLPDFPELKSLEVLRELFS
jgi:DNA repair protein RecO (recombination protein O)